MINTFSHTLVNTKLFENKDVCIASNLEFYSAIPNRRVYTDHVSKSNFPHYMRLLGSYTIEKHRRKFFSGFLDQILHNVTTFYHVVAVVIKCFKSISSIALPKVIVC